MREVPTVDSGTFEVSAGTADAAPAEASTDWVVLSNPKQPARSVTDSSESSRRAEARPNARRLLDLGAGIGFGHRRGLL